MTKFTTKYQYVSWNDNVEDSSKRADIKKTKLEKAAEKLNTLEIKAPSVNNNKELNYVEVGEEILEEASY